MRKKQQQQELPGMPEISSLAKKATEYLNERDHVQEAQEKLGDLKVELTTEFRKAGLSKIRVAGYTISYRHKEADSVIVKADAKEI
jgi:hypothetical protein